MLPEPWQYLEAELSKVRDRLNALENRLTPGPQPMPHRPGAPASPVGAMTLEEKLAAPVSPEQKLERIRNSMNRWASHGDNALFHNDIIVILGAPLASPWRPIETAPTSEAEAVLVHSRSWDDGLPRVGRPGNWPRTATHWAPIPPLPRKSP